MPVSDFRPTDRRQAIAAALATAGGLFAATAAEAQRQSAPLPAPPTPAKAAPASAFGLEPNTARDQSKTMQAAIDATSASGAALTLPPGRFVVGNLTLRSGARLAGTAGQTILGFTGGDSLISAEGLVGPAIEDLVIDGAGLPLPGWRDGALVTLSGCVGLSLANIEVRNSFAHGVRLERSAGRIVGGQFHHLGESAIFARDSKGLEIAHNVIHDCLNNGILVWRTTSGEDGALVLSNRIERIGAKNGGSGENGNGVNIFKAGNVLVALNRIADCAYTAVRGNAANNIQIVSNAVSRSGEVGLYAEFGFEGALIANNVVDGAATGIAVTNFNEGGRLAVVQGNIVRNLVRREYEAVDKRGDGIGVEADAVVTGNVIENAPNAGLLIGWGHYMRDVVATGNLVRGARWGIAVTGDPRAGQCLLANNMIMGANDGAIRAMRQWTPMTPDLVKSPERAPAGLTLAGNVAGAARG